MARVHVIEEVCHEDDPLPDDWTLWLQWGLYIYDNVEPQHGYRIIYKYPPNAKKGGARDLAPTRGQARIPTLAQLETLIAKARAAGWGAFDGDGFWASVAAAPAEPASD